MNIIVDIGHPAHVHLFRNAAQNWVNRGWKVVFTIRDKNIIKSLTQSYGFDYFIASKPRTTKVGLFYELIEHDLNVFRVARKIKADILIGTSVSITHVSKILGSKSIVFNEDDEDYLQSFRLLAYPFADTIVIPDVLRDKRTAKHATYSSYHELAYLHPNHFTPDIEVLKDLGISNGERYFVVRMVELKAHHDAGHVGLTHETRRKILQLLSGYGKVFITAEGQIPDEFRKYVLPIRPERIHDVLGLSSMLVSDSQTMTIEAAVLGVPAVRVNTFVGMCSVIEELEKKYGLAYGFHPDEVEDVLGTIKNLLDNPSLKSDWEKKRYRMLQEKVDLAKWMDDFIKSYKY